MDTIIAFVKEVFGWFYEHKEQIKYAITILGFLLAPVVVYVKGFMKPVLKALGLVGEKHGNIIANFIYKVFKVEKPKEDDKIEKSMRSEKSSTENKDTTGNTS
jgi:hypothetical protein